jgi:hypothetical protein
VSINEYRDEHWQPQTPDFGQEVTITEHGLPQAWMRDVAHRLDRLQREVGELRDRLERLEAKP